MPEPTAPPEGTPPADAGRRRLVAAGATALVAGLGLALWRHPEPTPPDAPADPALQAFWTQSFDRPEGGELAMASLRGKPLLINFWATWCAPCVREMPQLDQFHQAQRSRGWQVLGLAIDGPTPVREFLQRVKVGFPIALAGIDGTDLVRQLGNAQGGLPFTVLVDAAGRIAQRKMGELLPEDLARWSSQG